MRILEWFKAVLRVSFPFLLLILAATGILTFLISSSYLLNRSAEETIERAVERSVGFVLIDAYLNDTLLREIRRLEGVEFVREVRWFPSELGNMTFRVIVAGDVPRQVLPDIIRGNYPKSPGECAVAESSYLDLGRPPLGSTLELRSMNLTFECKLVGTFAAWALSPYRRTVVASLEPNSAKKIYLLKLRLGNVDRALEGILELLNCGECVRYVGGSEEFALDFLRSYRDLSQVLLISLTSISVIGLASVGVIELRRSSRVVGLIVLQGVSWSSLMAVKLFLTLISSSLGVVLGLLLSWEYGINFGEFVTGRCLMNLWRYRWDYLVGSVQYSIMMPSALLLALILAAWRLGRFDMGKILS